MDPARNARTPPAAPVAAVRGAWRSRAALGRDLLGIAAIAALTFLGLWLGGRKDLTNTAVAYLFVIALVSMRLGYVPAIFAAIASALCFDYFFLPPYGSFNIDNGRDLVTEFAMCGVAIFVSTLNERLRKQARAARLSERRTESLYALVKELAAAHSIDELIVTGLRKIESAAGVSAHILIRNGGEDFQRAFSSGGRVSQQTEDLGAARWAADHMEPAGQGSENLSTASACYVPLIAVRGCIGVLALRAREIASTAVVEPSSLIHAMARQLAMAIERALLAEEKRLAEIEAETERTRNAVLSSVSHDLRTPLTVITSASSTLLQHGERLQVAARAEMLRLIDEEARRLSDLLKSLLDLTRLQDGRLCVNRDCESLEEIVDSAVRRVGERTRLGAWRLRTRLPDNLPLVEIDATLIEQVLMNLIDNALAYAGNDLPVDITVSAPEEAEILVSVSDHGKGIRGDELTRIFDKFYRSGGTSGPGLGLGLTLARGIVEAHGGRIWATSTPGGGLTVQFTMPMSDVAPRTTAAEPGEGARAWAR